MSTKSVILEVCVLCSVLASPFIIILLMRKEKNMESKTMRQNVFRKIGLAMIDIFIGIFTLVFKGISFLMVGDSRMIDEITESEEQSMEQ